MPELPDVEVFRRYLDATALHQTIAGLDASDDRLVAGETPRALAEYLRGHHFERSYRHGKHLFAALETGRWLEWHFGMTGYFAYHKDQEEVPEEGHVRFLLENGAQLLFLDQRKLGHVAALDDLDAYLAELGLGIDALDPELDEATFRSLAEGRRGQVKCWLMDQSTMAGIGNVYSDEILFHAGIHPRQPLEALTDEGLDRLHRHLRSVLEAAIEAGVDPEKMPSDFLVPLREEREADCPRCGEALTKIKACGRRARVCPRCQPGPD